MGITDAKLKRQKLLAPHHRMPVARHVASELHKAGGTQLHLKIETQLAAAGCRWL